MVWIFVAAGFASVPDVTRLPLAMKAPLSCRARHASPLPTPAALNCKTPPRPQAPRSDHSHKTSTLLPKEVIANHANSANRAQDCEGGPGAHAIAPGGVWGRRPPGISLPF